jgi:DNA-binding IclR family transcriptional regulator
MNDDQGTEKDRNFVTALARGLELLRAFEAGETYLGNGELSKRTRIPKPSVSRLTYTLTQLGYLKYNSHLEKYQLGPGVLALGYRFFAGHGIRQLARPYMQELANSTDCTIALGDVDRNAITYIDVCQGTGPLVVRLEAGSRLPLISTAIGRAWLCGVSEQRRALILDQLKTIMKGRTSILITHRFNALSEIDRIFVLDEGRLIEEGTHQELLEKGGLYADMYERQKLKEQLD